MFLADPDDFTVSPNATEYYVSFANDTPLGTAVTTFSVVLNHSYWDSPVDRVFVGLVHVGADDTILNSVGLQSNGADTYNIEAVNISEANREVEFSLYYNMVPPDTVSYPYDFSVMLEIRVIGRVSGIFLIEETDGFLNGRITIGRIIMYYTLVKGLLHVKLWVSSHCYAERQISRRTIFADCVI